MRCRQIEELLDVYLAGELEPELARQVEQHLEDCATCQSLFLPIDPELDSLLIDGDWLAMEPSSDWTARVLPQTKPSHVSWKRLGILSFFWSSYMTVWLLIALRLWRPAFFTGMVAGLGKFARLLLPLWTAIQAIWRTLRLVQVNPVVCVVLLLLSGLAVFGIRRLEKEGLA